MSVENSRGLDARDPANVNPPAPEWCEFHGVPEAGFARLRYDPCLPDPAGVHRVHRLALLAAKGLSERIEVLHRSVDPPDAGRVWIHQSRLPGRCIGLVLAPDLREADEVALCLGVAVHLVVD